MCLPLRLMTAELHLLTKQDKAKKTERNNMANANRNVHFWREEEKIGLILSLLTEMDIIKIQARMENAF